MISFVPSFKEKCLSLFIVILASIIQSMAKYDIDKVLLPIDNTNWIHGFSLLDAIFTFIFSVIIWIIIVVLSHLLLISFNKQGSISNYLFSSGYGYILIAISNTISYILSSKLIRNLEVYKEMSMSNEYLQNYLNNSDVYKIITTQSRISEILFLIWCSYVVKNIYNVSFIASLLYVSIPLLLILFFSLGFSLL